MADKPLLIFPNPIEAAWPEGPPRGGASNYHFPSVQKQKDRLTPQFEAMLQSVVTDSSTGIEPERVLVIETIGEIDDFARAVRAIDGLEWLAEIDSDAIEPDIDFYDRPKIGKHLLYTNIEGVSKRKSLEIRNILERESFVDKYGTLLDRDLKDFIPYLPEEFEELREEIFATLEVASRPTKLIKRRLFLSMSNRRAMEHLLRLWKQWDSDRTLPFRYQKWSDIFSFLRVIRPWNVDDRLRETGVLEYWAKNLQFYQQEGALIPFEVELWYRDDLTKRQEAVNIITALIQSEGGRVVRTCTIEEIRFCALKAELPADKIERVLASKYIELFRCEDVMFFRPIGQCAVGELPAGELGEFTPGEVSGDPVVAILDGYPFANHDLLINRLTVDDPDDYNSGYNQAAEYQHGTAIASLICHGELDANEHPLTTPVYIRPIMKPSDSHINRGELIPEDQFIEDLIERSVRRIFEGIEGEGPIAPTVKIINVSIGIPTRMFFYSLSSCARLLDWLSYKYHVLFCVSSGNITDDINLGIDEEQLSSMSDEEVSAHTLGVLHNDNRNRRIISPAESINSITVGSMNSDQSGTSNMGNRVDILPNELLPSPVTSHGHGFRASIKPEIYISGGRTLYSHTNNDSYTINNSGLGPGQEVATVAVRPGETSRTVYCGGTSNSAALASRSAALIYEAIVDLLSQNDYTLPDENVAVLLKSLLVHSASWGNSRRVMKDLLGTSINRDSMSKYLGYGTPDIKRVLECTQQRATAIGYGQIKKKERHEFRLPIPPSLDGMSETRRLTITLAWFSPINPNHRNFRRANLRFTPPEGDVAKDRQEADGRKVRKGTVQHEILKGAKVIAYQDGDSLLIPVECREDAGTLDETVYYGLAVTLEVKEGVDIPIYDEIKQRIDVPIAIQDNQ